MIERLKSGLRRWEWGGLVDTVDNIKSQGLRNLEHLGTSAEIDDDGSLQINVGAYGRKATSVVVRFDDQERPVTISATQALDTDIPGASTVLHRTLEKVEGDVIIHGDLGHHALRAVMNNAEALLVYGHQDTAIISTATQFGQPETSTLDM